MAPAWILQPFPPLWCHCPACQPTRCGAGWSSCPHGQSLLDFWLSEMVRIPLAGHSSSLSLSVNKPRGSGSSTATSLLMPVFLKFLAPYAFSFSWFVQPVECLILAHSPQESSLGVQLGNPFTCSWLLLLPHLLSAASTTCSAVLVVLPQLLWGERSSASLGPRRGTVPMPRDDKRRELSLAFFL